jgi:hypothetical protein
VLLFWCFILVSWSATAFASLGRRHIDTFFTVWVVRHPDEHTMESSQFRDKVQRFEDNMGRAFTVRRFELIAVKAVFLKLSV